jgi:hypothetical protein
MKPVQLPCLLLTATSLHAGETRPLSTDRPDTTESPYTVDAGRWQFEMEIAAWTRDGGASQRFNWGELNLKHGLSASADVQFVLPFYTRIVGGDEGFGDMQVRLKYNLWGNDAGSDALAIMPYLKLPTARNGIGNGDLEGGLIVPYGFDGPAGWAFGLMGEIDIISDEDSGGYQPVGLVSATASRALTERSGMFFELVGIFTPESRDEREGYFNTGMTWALSEAVQLDGGIRVGLTRASADFSPFVGISTKF